MVSLFVSYDLGAVARICERDLDRRGQIQHDGAATQSIERYLDALASVRSLRRVPTRSDKPVQLLSVEIVDSSGRRLEAPRQACDYPDSSCRP